MIRRENAPGYLARSSQIIAVTYAVAGKNISLALALAAQFFSPLTVVMLAINPLIQMPAMASFLRWSPRLAKKYKPTP